MQRIRHLVITAALAATTVAATCSPAAAATAATDAWYCTGTAVWQVSPATQTATWQVLDSTCSGGSASVGPGLNNDVATSTVNSGASPVYGVRYIPAANTTAPVGAFSGVVGQNWSAGGTVAGTINGVNGAALAVDLVWNSDTTSPASDASQVAHFSGDVSCGSYCFYTSVYWEGQGAWA